MINVIGLGYIGLPTALMLAAHGMDIVGTDYSKELIDTLKVGKTTFKEKGIEELFHRLLTMVSHSQRNINGLTFILYPFRLLTILSVKK